MLYNYKNMKKIFVSVPSHTGNSTTGKPCCEIINIIIVCAMHKTSNSISVYIRNHQYNDGHGYRITTFSESSTRYQSCCAPMRQSDTVDYRSFTQTCLEDCISASNREALERLLRSLAEHEETNSAPDGMLEEADAHVEVETVETEPESKPKSNKRKWLFGLGASTVLAGVIAYVFKNN